VFKVTPVPAIAFRPDSSAATWVATSGTLTAASAATFFAPLSPVTGDALEELTVVVDPAGQSGGVKLTRTKPGVAEDLGVGSYPAVAGVQTVSLPLPNRPEFADPATWQYIVSVEMKPGVVLHGARLLYLSGTSTLITVAPVRAWDTRLQGDKLASGDSLGFSLSLVGVPNFISEALLNVTVDQTEGQGYLTVFGPGENGGRPNTSNLNWFTANQIAANLVISRLGAESSVSMYAGGNGRTHVIVDVLGYFV
jgi:hypothetical protein